MAVTKPSKRPARPTKGTCASSLAPALFKQSVEFSAAMLSLVRLSRSEPSPGRSKPRLEWEKQHADAERKAIKTLLNDRAEGMDDALLAKLLIFGQHAPRVGITYEAAGAPGLKRTHPVGFVAAVLRPWPRTGGGGL